jgi:predicted transcriptional regulator
MTVGRSERAKGIGMSEIEATNDVAALTVQLLSAYLSNNTVASEDLAGLIRSTKEALTGEAAADLQAEPESFTPAVSARKSLASREHIISLIDGRPYKTLKRHLMSHGLTPDAYRSRYNLPASYPMVAPAYADKRREVAQQLGLGRKKPDAADSATANAAAEVISGSAEQHTDASSPIETKQDRAPAEKKGRARPAKAAGAKNPDTAVALSLEATKDATLDEAATLTPPESTPAEAPSAPKRQAKPASKKPKSTSAGTEAAAGRRGKSKAEAGGASVTAAEVSAASQDGAADELSVQKPKRRTKLGIFKKSDDAQAGAPDEGANAAPPAHDPVPAVAAAETPTKRKSPKRRHRTGRVRRPALPLVKRRNAPVVARHAMPGAF